MRRVVSEVQLKLFAGQNTYQLSSPPLLSRPSVASTASKNTNPHRQQQTTTPRPPLQHHTHMLQSAPDSSNALQDQQPKTQNPVQKGLLCRPNTPARNHRSS